MSYDEIAKKLDANERIPLSALDEHGEWFFMLLCNSAIKSVQVDHTLYEFNLIACKRDDIKPSQHLYYINNTTCFDSSAVRDMVRNMVKLYKEDVEMAVCLMHEWYELKIELLETDVDK